MAHMVPRAPVANELGRYRILSPFSGVRVSPICLGAMSLGEAWSGEFVGGTNEAEAFKFLDTFYDNGGNFIDTANNYQDGESEKLVGSWMKARGNRDEIVIATKYTIAYKNIDPNVRLKVNYQGNHKKSLYLSVEDSLKKLQTDYIDILYIHLWDYTTSVPELMQSLDSLVKDRKVLYLGISDTPAWLVQKANDYARFHGMAQFVVYSGEWSLVRRSLEREILPLCRAEGMALCPWGVVGGGKFKTREEIALRGGALRGGVAQTAAEEKISAALAEVAAAVGDGATLGAVTVAWAMHKAPYVFPVLGGRRPEQLMELVKGLSIPLSAEQIESLEEAVPFEWGFPYEYFGRDPAVTDGVGSAFVQAAGHTKFVLAEQPIRPGPVKSEYH